MVKATAEAKVADTTPGAKADSELLIAALETIRLDPPLKSDHERMVALFVTGQKMAEGSLADMKKRFQQEVDSHSGSVQLKELRGGDWTVIQSRRAQQRV